MKALIPLVVLFCISCSSDSDFKEFALGETHDEQLRIIVEYLDTVQSVSDSIGYETGNGSVIVIKGRKGQVGGYQFESPPGLSEVMFSRKIRFILRLRSHECVLVNYRNYDGSGVDRYLVYHSVPLDSCEYFKNKTDLTLQPDENFGYINLDSNWTISIEELTGPFDKLNE